tara:strand:- start:452 stop:556 length:105 start_codon:yes stop_codon:yes gene_type:complete
VELHQEIEVVEVEQVDIDFQMGQLLAVIQQDQVL